MFKHLFFLVACIQITTPLSHAMKPIDCPNVNLAWSSNSCFMDAALQCLFRTRPMYEYFTQTISKNYYASIDISDIAKQPPITTRGSSRILDVSNVTLNKTLRVALLKTLIKIFNDIKDKQDSNRQDKYDARAQLSNFLINKYLFRGSTIDASFYAGKRAQEDAYEFIQQLFGIIAANNDSDYQQNSDGSLTMTIPYNESEQAIRKQIASFFGIKESSLLELKCGHYYSKNVTDFITQLEITDPQDPQDPITLEACLNNRTQAEQIGFSTNHLGEREDYRIECEMCKSKQVGNKQLLYKELSSILVLSLKRFLFEGEGGKITRPVSIPEVLTINEEWVTPDCAQQGSHYQLYGLLLHNGDVGYGHYTAYTKNYKDNKWYFFDDLSQKYAQQDPNLSNPDIYTVFYQRIEHSSMHPDPSPGEETDTPPSDTNATTDRLNDLALNLRALQKNLQELASQLAILQLKINGEA